MSKPKFNNETTKLLKHLSTALTIFTIIGQTTLTGCASIDHKDQSVEAILVKESALIEKVKAERSTVEVQQGVSQSESLVKAEAHLSLAFEEMLKANEAVMTKILKQNKEEVRNERYESSIR
jgi:hypothetical protein